MTTTWNPGAGWIVSPRDEEGIRAALREALTDRAELRRRADNARRLVQEKLTWDKTIDPLDRFDPRGKVKMQTRLGTLSHGKAIVQDLSAVRLGP